MEKQGWSNLSKDAAVEGLVGETPTSATETVALPECRTAYGHINF
jgi:hypothetical protein